MDATIVSAIAAVLGSLVGGSASLATAWITQNTLNKREVIGAEIRKREMLYGEFIYGLYLVTGLCLSGCRMVTVLWQVSLGRFTTMMSEFLLRFAVKELVCAIILRNTLDPGYRPMFRIVYN